MVPVDGTCGPVVPVGGTCGPVVPVGGTRGPEVPVSRVILQELSICGSCPSWGAVHPWELTVAEGLTVAENWPLSEN